MGDKYRAWDKENKKMYYEIAIIHTDGNFELNHVECLREKDSITIFNPILTQFTGVIDKNSNMIYLGDIVKINGVHLMEVTFYNGAFKLVEIKPKVGMEFGDVWLHTLLPDCISGKLKHVEVVGNKFENEVDKL